jgi:hypothetical protein
VKECSSAAAGRGEAYWVGEMPTGAGRAHVATGSFNFRTNSFQGKFVSDRGRTGYYAKFEWQQPGDAEQHQLVPTDDPDDLEAAAALPMAEAEEVMAGVDVRGEEDAQDEARLAGLLSKYEPTTSTVAHLVPAHAVAVADVMIPASGVAISKPTPKNTLLGPPSGRKPLPLDFRKAVTMASMETTEVNAGSSSRRKKVTDPLNGGYDIQFETSQDGGTLVVNGTMELTFTRGFCGWNIHGTRRNHKNDDDNDDDDDEGLFSIQRGFLAQSGKMYWEERRELKPSYSVLVAGMLDTDTAGSFHGEWLSSREGGTNTTNNTGGRFLKFVRRHDSNALRENKNAAALSSSDGIV